MEDAFIVRGGVPLRGTVKLSGAKNVALKVLIAGLLFDNPITFSHIPHINDIDELLHLISKLGARSEFINGNTVVIDATHLSENTIDLLHASKIRVSFMLFAPLLHRFGIAVIPNPGGCRIGARPIDRLMDMLKAFDVNVSYDSSTGYYTALRKEKVLKGTHYRFEKPTHTGTELFIMLASRAQGKSRLDNAAAEPEIDDLIRLINQAGGKVYREKDAIVVEGVEKLSLSSFTIMSDRIEAATYASFALATGGDITVKGTAVEHMQPFIDYVRKSNGGVEINGRDIRFYKKDELTVTDIITGPYPQFSTDWQGPWAVLMTQAMGTSIIHETIFEGRFSYVAELLKLGAQIEFFQPDIPDPTSFYHFKIENNGQLKKLQQAIRISGKTELHNGVLNASDIRAGATLL